MSEFVSMSKACKGVNLSVRKVLEYLTREKIIPKDVRKNKKFYFDDKEFKIMSTGTSLRVDKKEFIDYLNEKNVVEKLSFDKEENEPLDRIDDVEKRFKKLSEIKNSRLMFIDAEFKDGNYHELAYEITENQNVVESGYFLVRENVLKKRMSGYDNKRLKRLKEHKIEYDIIPRKKVNKILRKKSKTVDFILAHNAFGERQILNINGINHAKEKFICTSNMASGYIFDLPPSLLDLNEYFGLGYNSYFTHYAFEDTAMARRLFFKMIERFENEFRDNT